MRTDRIENRLPMQTDEEINVNVKVGCYESLPGFMAMTAVASAIGALVWQFAPLAETTHGSSYPEMYRDFGKSFMITGTLTFCILALAKSNYSLNQRERAVMRKLQFTWDSIDAQDKKIARRRSE